VLSRSDSSEPADARIASAVPKRNVNTAFLQWEHPQLSTASVDAHDKPRARPQHTRPQHSKPEERHAAADVAVASAYPAGAPIPAILPAKAAEPAKVVIAGIMPSKAAEPAEAAEPARAAYPAGAPIPAIFPAKAAAASAEPAKAAAVSTAAVQPAAASPVKP
jgi:hypothetical protein